MISKIYPLQFTPILKDRLWGGIKLKSVLHKSITSKNVGESWEISSVDGDVSIVSNGVLAGMSLNDLIDSNPDAILGTHVHKQFGKQFPLLFKFLDAQKDLSIQVHPNDELAKKKHNSYGKTEMWYVIQADENATIIGGFNKKSNPEEFLNKITNQSLVSILDVKKVEKEDAFFLETGTVHAIGAGILIAEIQQTSDITYRLYDFDRKDELGNKRELHIDIALEAINFEKVTVQKKYDRISNQPNVMVDCPYFTTNFIPLDGNLLCTKNGKSFTVLMCVHGSFTLEGEGEKYYYQLGDTILIPAALKTYTIYGKASILEIYIS